MGTNNGELNILTNTMKTSADCYEMTIDYLGFQQGICVVLKGNLRVCILFLVML